MKLTVIIPVYNECQTIEKIINKVIKKSAVLIKKQGKLIIEFAYNQKLGVEKILKANGFFINKVIKDFSGHNRVIVSTKKD